VGGLACKPVLGEITYGLERLAMYLQGKDSVFDLVWTPGVTYRDVYHQNEVEQSRYNFELANVDLLFSHFNHFEAEAKRLIAAQCVLPGYEMVMKASHTFNLLDARGAVSVTERQAYIGRVRALAKGGRLVTCGGTTGPQTTQDVRLLFWRQLSILGSTMAHDREYREVMSLVFNGHRMRALRWLRINTRAW
jgi:hypothetical protein